VDLTDRAAIDAHEAEVKAASDAEARRLFYVAATRARTRLVLTASHWKRTKEGRPAQRPWPAIYLEELDDAGFEVAWPAESEVPDQNPLSPAPIVSPDRQPPEALEVAVAHGPDAVAQFRTGEPHEAALIAHIDDAARRILEREQSDPPTPASFEVTVTDLVAVSRDPAEFVRRRVLGLPEAPSEARRRGSLVHQWIEERGWALQDGSDPDLVTPPWRARSSDPPTSRTAASAPVVIDEDDGARSIPDDPPDPVDTDELADACAEAWLQTRFAPLVPAAVELPVVLTIGGIYLKGTVDALYEYADGTWEVVDIKTGPMPDATQWLQLEAYALALASDGRRLEDCQLTFVSLQEGRCQTVPARPEGELRSDIAAALERVTETIQATLR
jgi:DNA helicase-2/ATP-dependent DNA helicase PcrA